VLVLGSCLLGAGSPSVVAAPAWRVAYVRDRVRLAAGRPPAKCGKKPGGVPGPLGELAWLRPSHGGMGRRPLTACRDASQVPGDLVRW
jgi:hypothetical protein